MVDDSSMAEEIVAFFSDSIEKSQDALQEHIERSAFPDSTLGVERINAVLRVLEGHDGHASIRLNVRRFAQAQARGDKDAISLLDLDRIDGRARSASIELALREVLRASNGAGSESTQAELSSLRRQEMDADISNTLASLNTVYALPGERRRILQSYYDLITTQPSSLSAVNMLEQISPDKSLLAATNDMDAVLTSAASRSRDPGSSTHLLHVGSLMVVMQLMQIVRTIICDADDLQRLFSEASQSGANTLLNSKFSRRLFELTNSTNPGPNIEKIILELLVARAREKARREQLLRHLVKLAKRWPGTLWPTKDGLEILLKQLYLKQGSAHSKYRLMPR